MSKATQNVRVLIADDHPVFREGLRKLLLSEPGFVVVGEAADGVTALHMVDDYKPDLLLLDVAMPRLSGLDVLRELASSEHKVRTILLTAGIDKPSTIEALELGASGVILKDSAIELLRKSIHAVMSGQYWIDRESVSEIVRALHDLKTARPQERPPFNLTPRELEVIGTVVQGYTNKEIANRFLVSEQTVKHHLTNIFDKLGVSNRVELALFAVNHRLVSNS